MHVAKGLYRIPLMFFALAACFGLLLRWHVVHPLDWVHYPYMLHAHSHLMFLGWVTNALVIFGIEAYVADTKARWYRRVFFWLRAFRVGMAGSFPLQGHGVAPHVLSTLHYRFHPLSALPCFCPPTILPLTSPLLDLLTAPR